MASKICPHTPRGTTLLLFAALHASSKIIALLHAKRMYFGRVPCIRNELYMGVHTAGRQLKFGLLFQKLFVSMFVCFNGFFFQVMFVSSFVY